MVQSAQEVMMMPTETWEMEGTWEEILARSAELAGKRVHVKVFPEPATSNGQLSERNKKMLEDARALAARQLTPEEIQILDEFDEFRKQHPFRLNSLSEEI